MFQAFGTAFLFVWLAAFGLILFAFFYIFRTILREMRNARLGGGAVRSVIEALSREDGSQNVPRSLRGMDALLLPKIRADFPLFSEKQVKEEAAGYVKEHLYDRGYGSIVIHDVVLSDYAQYDPQKPITLQLAVQAVFMGRQQQKRYSVLCRSMETSFDQQQVWSSACPNCGAPLSGISAECPYCGSFVRRPVKELWQFSDLLEL